MPQPPKMKRRVRKAVQAAEFSPLKAKGVFAAMAKVKRVAHAIVKEIVAEMNLALSTSGKAFTANALDEWLPKLTDSVFTKLASGGNWANDRPNVLAVARDMAVIAALLSGGSNQVAKARVHAAFRAVKDHATCPGGPGSGRWCDFDI